MLHILIIALFMVVFLHDGWQSAAGEHGLATHASSPHVWAISLVPMLALALATWLVVAALSRDVARRGSWKSARLAERVLALSRWGAVLLHAANVLAFGLLDEIRFRIGDLIAIDELAVIALPIGVFLIGWWAYEPIERTLRDATTLRMLDSGQPVFAPPTRPQYVLLQFRHQILLSLVPIGLIATWAESMQRGLLWLAGHKGESGLLGRAGGLLAHDTAMAWAHTALQLVGVATPTAGTSAIAISARWAATSSAPTTTSCSGGWPSPNSRKRTPAAT